MAFKLSQAPAWLGRYPMLDTTHGDDLDMRASINEAHYGMPRHQAEERAHADYRRDQLIDAAAHHRTGMIAAHAAGNKEAAAKHSAMYVLALKAMGHRDAVNPPDEVVQRSKNTSSDVYNFKSHRGDAFALPPEPESEKPKARLESEVKGGAKLQKDDHFQQQGYQNHPIGATGGGLPHDQDKQDELINIAYHGAMPIEAKFSPQGKAAPKNVFHESQPVPASTHVQSADMSASPEAGVLAGALAARQALNWIRGKARKQQIR